MPTLGEMVDEYVAQHQGEENTRRALKKRLRYALATWLPRGCRGIARDEADRLQTDALAVAWAS